MENLGYKNENSEGKYLENMRNYQLLKVKNSLLELKKDFMELKDRELKDRKEKCKTEIKELFHKPIIVSEDDMDKFEEQEMKKIRPKIIRWFDWSIKQNVMEKKPKITRDKLKDKIINHIWTLSKTKKEKEERKKRKHNSRTNKDRIIR